MTAGAHAEAVAMYGTSGTRDAKAERIDDAEEKQRSELSAHLPRSLKVCGRGPAPTRPRRVGQAAVVARCANDQVGTVLRLAREGVA